MKNRFSKTAQEAEEDFRKAFDRLNVDGSGVPLAEMAEALKLAERTVRNRAGKMEEYRVKLNQVICVLPEESAISE